MDFHSVARIKKGPVTGAFFRILAERVGFEPTVRFNVRLISSYTHDTGTMRKSLILLLISCAHDAVFGHFAA